MSQTPIPSPQAGAQEAHDMGQPNAAVPVAGAQVAPERGSGTEGGGGFFMEVMMTMVLSAVVAIVVQYGWSRYVAPQGDKPGIEEILVTVNFDAIVKEQMQALTDRVRAGEVEASDMPALTEKFTVALMNKINDQGEAGRIVLRSDQVLAAPKSIPDLTDQFRKELRRERVMAAPVGDSAKSADTK